MTPSDWPKLESLVREAGAAAMRFYGVTQAIQTKEDSSPLTQADTASHEILVKGLEALTPEIPVISEESEAISWEQRSEWKTFWSVDPLDGTKEFLKSTGEFTVNIGLIENGIPTLGVIYAPAIDLLYIGQKDHGSFKKISGEKLTPIQVRPLLRKNLAVVASRDHAGPQVQALLNAFPEASLKSMGSSLKFCLVAEGSADLYLRDVPTMEWDTAAAHAILLAAGGTLLTLDQTPLAYNKPSLKNPGIISANSLPDWLSSVLFSI